MRIEHVHTEVGGAHAQQNAKLVDGARQFEAMMLEEMLKPLKFGSTSVNASDDNSDEGEGGGEADTIRGFAVEAVSKAIATAGGFGLAKQIIQQVTAEQKAQLGKKQDEV